MSEQAYSMARNVRRFLANRAGEGIAYPSWNEKFIGQQLREAGQMLADDIGPIPIAGFTAEQCEELGFGKWDEESDLRLIPIWLYPHLCPGEELTSINGEKRFVGVNYTTPETPGYIDNDNRFGCLAWGVTPLPNPPEAA